MQRSTLKTHALLVLFSLFGFVANAQIAYGTPPVELLPEKLKGLRNVIEVAHFPKECHPIKIDDLYYWKHTTSILSKESEIEIVDYGAYIYYNDQWNLRRSYPLNELDTTFGTQNQKMNQAEPYTWPKNYRVGDALFGGWALWYFIGTTPNGETVCGYETINTTNTILN